MITLFIIVNFLMLKHFVVDFLLQSPYMYLNKGDVKHFGGYAHAVLHSAVSLFGFSCILGFSQVVLVVCIMEAILHYTIDYSKVNINKKFSWRADTNSEFWYLLGLDQYLHQLTYVFMVSVLFSVGGGKLNG